MKYLRNILSLFLMACSVSALSGAIPQLINYQGLLLDDNGSKVTGVKAITLKVFTGATDGNGTKEIYDENVGNVAVTDGLYAFNFGGTGQSVITTTETVGTGNGSTQIFNYTVEHAPILDGTTSITKYVSDSNATVVDSWTQTGGSSNPSYIASVVNASGAISVTNAGSAPASGQHIEVVYDYNSVGIMGALATSPTAWLEVSVDGSPLLPRQRLVAVPFANVAGTIQGENLAVDVISGDVKIKNNITKMDGSSIVEFGGYQSKSDNTVYTAESAGFVMARVNQYTTGYIYTNNNANGTGNVNQERARAETNNYTNAYRSRYSHLCVPVPKGYQWKTQNCTNVLWVSFGN